MRALAEDPPEPHDPQHDAEAHVEDDVGEIEEGRAGECRQVGAVQQKQNEPRGRDSSSADHIGIGLTTDVKPARLGYPKSWTACP